MVGDHASRLESRTLCAQAHRQRSAEVPRSLEADRDYGENHMLFVGIVVVFVATLTIARMRVRGGVNGADLGWMSEAWLAAHRASQSA